MTSRAGRKSRLAARAAPPPVDPAPRGPRGGQYRPLSDTDVVAIIDAAYRILDEVGMGEVPDDLRAELLAIGARDAGARLTFPAAMIDRVLAASPKTLTLCGRDPSRSITVGGDTVHFGTGGAAVETLDPRLGHYRAATLKDLYDFTRLADKMDALSWFTRCCVATDMVGIRDLDINTVYALLRGTTKPVATSFTVADYVDPIANMLRLAGDFDAAPWVFAHISPIISPLRYGDDAVAVTRACIRHGIPLNCIVAAQAGATAPAPPAAFLAASTAETLAALIMVHAIRPGTPMIFSNWPLVIDLRTGAFAGAGGESALMNAASAQIINHLGLPSGVAASMTDSKAVDAQMGADKGLTALAAGLSGANMVFESAGMMAALLGASFEAMVADNETLRTVLRILRGV
ncbi:MAG: trimethylamine methyltransferase family protein, partial [Pseudomonadota bacterium]